MYYDKEFFDWYKRTYQLQSPPIWEELQLVRKQQDDKAKALNMLVTETEAKITKIKERLEKKNKKLAEYQAKLASRNKEILVCIRSLKNTRK